MSRRWPRGARLSARCGDQAGGDLKDTRWNGSRTRRTGCAHSSRISAVATHEHKDCEWVFSDWEPVIFKLYRRHVLDGKMLLCGDALILFVDFDKKIW